MLVFPYVKTVFTCHKQIKYQQGSNQGLGVWDIVTLSFQSLIIRI